MRQGFDDLRSLAVVTLLVAHPDLSAPALTQTVVSGESPLGMRLNCLAWLCRAASALSGDGQQPGGGPDSATHAKLVASANIEVRDKTTVKRPAVLAAQKKAVLLRRNKFATLSDLFFLPVLALLGSLAEKDVSPLQSSRPVRLIVDLSEDEPKSPVAAAPSSPQLLAGLDSMLPTQALLALATFVRCSANSMRER